MKNEDAIEIDVEEIAGFHNLLKLIADRTPSDDRPTFIQHMLSETDGALAVPMLRGAEKMSPLIMEGVMLAVKEVQKDKTLDLALSDALLVACENALSVLLLMFARSAAGDYDDHLLGARSGLDAVVSNSVATLIKTLESSDVLVEHIAEGAAEAEAEDEHAPSVTH